ncbi:dynamin family protein [Lysinibacillus sp. BW-2-10]|uniref:dynamin family protein n=1 Tax=Lysinibacillus sp. BW-2-10 TaxID=2590030 RepID=UPI001180D98A|nr:dynamin family protein [Lysinibacillus sp. BW-2-10]TSI05124.1 hypothetical protein FJQ64_12465 [Lysinibacillus sp. BW-2-10]
MELRTKWNEKTELVQQAFEQAFTLAENVKDELGQYVTIEKEIDILKSQQKNWQQNRFEIVIVGEFSTGKSTFINALLRKEVLPSKVTPTTATVNFIRHLDDGPGRELAIVHFQDGKTVGVSFDELDEYVTEMSKKLEVSSQVKYVDIFIDSPYLKDGVVLVDTPGLQALHPEHERITKEQIKKSNASILLFNLEQPGKQTEFKFLRELADSIDRIFFVGNRLDGVPEDQIQEVIDILEGALKQNDYQSVPTDRAKLYPLSALQALKSRDTNVKTKHWEDTPAEELFSQSRFGNFEQQLESYLFDGEKAQDLLRAPYLSILNFYSELGRKLAEVKELVAGQIDIEQLEAQQQRLMDEIELRKIQLKNDIMQLKNLFQDEIRASEQDFNSRFDKLVDDIKESVNQVISNEELEEMIQHEILSFNNRYELLFTQSVDDLAGRLNDVMRQRLDGFEVNVDTSTIQIDTSVKANLAIKNTKKLDIMQIREEVEAKFKAQQQDIEEDKELLKRKIEAEANLKFKQMEIDEMKKRHDEEVAFRNMLINRTSATKKEYGVIKERTLWFDKKGFRDVKNEEYDLLIEQRRRIMKENEEKLSTARREQMEAMFSSSAISSNFEDMEDFREAKRELRHQKEATYLQQVSEHAQAMDRALEKEKRRILRDLESALLTKKRDYRSFLRDLDALKIAQERITQYTEEQDQSLAESQKHLEERKQLIEQNTNEQARISEIVGNIEKVISAENARIQIEII